jgi:hypothetical protein
MYSQQISATLNLPALLCFLPDVSGSMAQQWGGSTQRSKAEEVADIVNRLLETLVTQCSLGEETRDYFHLLFICYGGPSLGGLAGESPRFQSISELKAMTQWEKRWQKVPDGAGGLVEMEIDFPVWLRPRALGGTPMHLALETATALTQQWISAHPDSFPPMVFNITDGQPDSPAEAEAAAERLRRLETSDGQVLLFNCHISETAHGSVTLPASDVGLPDETARLLYRMSSTLPAPMVARARPLGYEVAANARGFVYNADPVSLIQLLDIGTRPLNALMAPQE